MANVLRLPSKPTGMGKFGWELMWRTEKEQMQSFSNVWRTDIWGGKNTNVDFTVHREESGAGVWQETMLKTEKSVNHGMCLKIRNIDLTVAPIFQSMHCSLDHFCFFLLTPLFLRNSWFVVLSCGSAIALLLLAEEAGSSCFCPGSLHCSSGRGVGVCNKESSWMVYQDCR